ncbi:MAG: FecR domain-containing protein [Opitutaceae bacterium]|nr:FecR domain-containing protein [Opitutaceae bacterium]
MTTDDNPPTPPLLTRKGGTALDWPTESGMADAILEKLKVRRKKKSRRRMVAGAGVAMGIVMLWAIPFVRQTGSFSAPVAQSKAIVLPDGSQAELNAQTEIRTDFRYGRRTVDLKAGEAYFSVSKDADHPFVVRTPQGTVRVLGTVFNVRVSPDQPPVVTLFEGSVAIENDHQKSIRLAPGQQVDATDQTIRTLAPHELEAVIAWRSGLFAFDGLTLAEAAERLGAFHGRTIIVAPELAQRKAAGNFPVKDLPLILSALETAFSVQIAEMPDGSFRIGSR